MFCSYNPSIVALIIGFSGLYEFLASINNTCLRVQYRLEWKHANYVRNRISTQLVFKTTSDGLFFMQEKMLAYA